MGDMRRKVSRPIALLLFSLLIICLFVIQAGRARGQNSSRQENKSRPQPISRHVILITISGLTPEIVAPAESQRLRIPTIRSLRAGGSFAVGIESVFPSQSIPAHASILTGTQPSDHGVTSDYPFEVKEALQSGLPYQSAKAIKTDTLFELAGRAKLLTAAVGFPLTSGAAVDFNLPDEAGAPDKQDKSGKIDGTKPASRPPTENLNDHPPGLRAEILSKMKTPSTTVAPGKGPEIFQHSEDLFKASAAAYLIEKHRPNLLLVNFSSFDAAQRRYGALSEESVKSLEITDGLIKEIVDAAKRSQIEEETTFILVSDSGVAKVEKEYSPNVLLAKKGWLTTDAQGKIVSWQAAVQSLGGSAAVFVKDPQDEKLAREVEAFFHEQAEKPDSPIWRVLSKRDAAKLGADPRAAFYLDAAPTYAFSARTTGSLITKAPYRGARGYAPSRVEMRAAFIIAGNGIKSNIKVEYARLIDVAPTIARLLGLEMKTARGRVITEVIKQ
jgi:predicted AlkP superfamily pyrophosphatase or phosphodiesterase